MDVRLLTILTLCLVDAEVKTNSTSTSISPSVSSTSPSPTSTSRPCVIPASSARPPGPSPPAPPPDLAVVQVKWEKPCEGQVTLSLLPSNTSRSWVTLPLCHEPEGQAGGLAGGLPGRLAEALPGGLAELDWTGVCGRRGCKGPPSWTNPHSSKGHDLLKIRTFSQRQCRTLRIQCQGAPAQTGEVVGYKVVTALLCVLFLLVLVVRFGKPSLKALQKRMSDRRQSRWIGPTQSQSVSYHRGKSAVQPSEDGGVRSSFAALERLTVNYSREPSSNRNSDYDSYN